MNFPDRVALIDGTTRTEVPASVALVSTKEAEGVFALSDVSVRVPRGVAVLPTTGKVQFLTGPYIGKTIGVAQIRPNRTHTRYIVSGLTG